MRLSSSTLLLLALSGCHPPTARCPPVISALPSVAASPGRESLAASPAKESLAASPAKESLAASPAAASPAKESPAQESPARRARFDFRSQPWINLHHALYQEARRGAVSDQAEPRAWVDAVDYYRRELIDHDLLFDARLVELGHRLSDAGAAQTLGESGVEPELARRLEAAMPIYRDRRWPAQDRANQAFIAALTPLLARDGERLATELARLFDQPWPDRPVRVELTGFATRFGAYTTDRVTISTVDARNQGPTALEVLFHESSHLLVERIERSIAREFASRGRAAPPTLWHAVLFFTTGETVRRVLDGYVPYGDRLGVYQRGPDWARYRVALEVTWRPYLDGKIDLDGAIGQLVTWLERH